MTAPFGLPGAGPRGITSQTADRTEDPTDIRMGTVLAVTSRGVSVDVAGGLVADASHLNSYNPAVGDYVVLVRFRDAWVVQGRVVGPGTPTDLATAGSGVGTTLLTGCALTGSGATLASSTGSLVTVPRYRCTYYHPPGHQVLILGGASWYSSVLNDTMWIMLYDAVTGVQMNLIDLTQAGTIAFGHFETFGAMMPPSMGGRKVDLYMAIQRAGGTGTSRVDDAAGRRGYMVALDMGDSSVVATV